MRTAEISEVFFSVQGEAVFIGHPQIFVRFAGCNLACRYCDLPGDAPSTTFTADRLIRRVAAIARKAGAVHSVSLTGGEPLLQAGFLAGFLPRLKRRGFRTYLETNGTLPAQLAKVGEFLDFIAMDLKLPSATGRPAEWKAHRDFLRRCLDLPCSTFVKAVVTGRTRTADVARAAALVREMDPGLPLVIQPEIGPDGQPAVGSRKLLLLLEAALKITPSARLIPPVHRFLHLP